MLDDESLDAGERWVEDWQAKLEQRLERTRALAAGLREIQGTARSDNGLVTVKVDSSGALLSLDLAEEVRRHSARWIADQVLATTRAARADLTRAAAEMASKSEGADTPEARSVLAAIMSRSGEPER